MISSRVFVFNLLMRLLPETRFFPMKAMMLRWCGAKVGKNVRINSSVHILGVGKLTIGDDVWIGNDCIIMAMYPATIQIGDCVDIAPGVYISTGTHEVDITGAHSAGNGINKDITIDEGVWLGARSIILPGVVIGKKSVVGAGALINKSIPKRSVAVGVPAKVKREF